MFGVGNLFFNFKFLVYICLFYILYKIEKLIKKKKNLIISFLGVWGVKFILDVFLVFMMIFFDKIYLI